LSIFSLAVVVLLVAGGVRSFIYWSGRGLEKGADSKRLVFFAVFITGRVGVWFSLAGFVVILSLVADASGFKWFIVVPGLFAVAQILSSYALAHGGPPEE
jgi:hypothetical protein